MKYSVQKLSNSSASQIGRVGIGDVEISVACKKELVVGLVNGYKVVDAGLYDDFIEQISPIMARIIAKIYRDKWSSVTPENSLVFYNEDWDTKGLYPSKNLLDKILFYLKKHLDSNVIQIISRTEPAKPAVILPAPKIDLESLSIRLNRYRSQLENLSMFLDRSVELSNILTRRKLIPTMYGAEPTQKILDSIRNKVTLLRPELDNIPAWSNLSIKSINGLTYRLDKNLLNVESEKSYITLVLIPNILDNYERIKTLAMKLVVTLAPLVYIDEVFNTYVKYPASWFLPTNNMQDLNESYEVIIEFLAGASVIESTLMDPLNLLKVKNSIKGPRDVR